LKKEEKFEIPATRCHPPEFLPFFYLEPQIFVFVAQGRHRLLDGHLALGAPLGVA
jgi:hypothetical protein